MANVDVDFKAHLTTGTPLAVPENEFYNQSFLHHLVSSVTTLQAEQ